MAIIAGSDHNRGLPDWEKSRCTEQRQLERLLIKRLKPVFCILCHAPIQVLRSGDVRQLWRCDPFDMKGWQTVASGLLQNTPEIHASLRDPEDSCLGSAGLVIGCGSDAKKRI